MQFSFFEEIWVLIHGIFSIKSAKWVVIYHLLLSSMLKNNDFFDKKGVRSYKLVWGRDTWRLIYIL